MGLLIVILLIACGIGMYVGRLGIGYGLCAVVLGLFLSGTSMGHSIMDVMHPIGVAISSTTSAINK